MGKEFFFQYSPKIYLNNLVEYPVSLHQWKLFALHNDQKEIKKIDQTKMDSISSFIES